MNNSDTCGVLGPHPCPLPSRTQAGGEVRPEPQQGAWSPLRTPSPALASRSEALRSPSPCMEGCRPSLPGQTGGAGAH